MPYIKPLDRDEIPELKALLDGVETKFGFVPNSMLTMARKPELVKALVPMLGAVFGPGTVTREIKRLAAFGVSHQAGCQYCVAHMTHGAIHDGIPKDKIVDLCNSTPQKLTPAEQGVLNVAQGAAKNPNGVNAEDFETLKMYFDDTQIVEIVAVIAMMGFFNRWNDTMATQLEQPSIDTATSVLPRDIWSIGKHGELRGSHLEK